MRVIEARVLMGKDKTLQVFIDRKEGNEPISTSDCKTANDWFDLNPDSLEWVTGAYNLEISSPGIEKPLRLEEDWKSAVGKEVSFLLESPVMEHRKGQGVVESVGPNKTVSIKITGKKGSEPIQIEFALDNLSKANLVYNPSIGVK